MAHHAGQYFTSLVHHDTYRSIETSNHRGRCVCIIGASRGIGRATALAFARAGASTLILAARSDLDALKDDILSIAPSKVITISLDVTSDKEVDAAVKVVKQHVSSIDVLVNNAGYLAEFKPIGETVTSEWSKSWEINVKGTYLIARAFIPLVLQSSAKTIVNVGSRAALHTRFGASAYGVSKSAVLRLTDYLDFEYKEKGLVALTVHPGSVATELSLRMPDYAHAVLVDKPELAANTITWLTQERRPWLAGRYVSVNWDMEELDSRKDEIVQGDKLKLRLVI